MRLLLATVAASLALTAPASAATRPADDFENKIGVNIHTVHGWGPYASAEGIRQALRDVEIRHVRDSWTRPGNIWEDHWHWDYLKLLADDGVGIQLILTAGISWHDDDQWLETTRAKIRHYAHTLVGVEGHNEDTWTERTCDAQRHIFTMLRSDAWFSDKWILAPSYFQAWQYPYYFELCGEDGNRWDDGSNLHPYPGGLPETSEHLQWAFVDMGKSQSPGEGRQATETGYHGPNECSWAHPAVTDVEAARYLPKTLLELFQADAWRIYIYELFDQVDRVPYPDYQGCDYEWGLVDVNGAMKRQGRAVRNWMRLMQDPGTVDDPSAYDVAVSDPAGVAERMVFEKADDSRWIALWNEQDRASRTVTVTLPETASTVRIYSPWSGTSVSSTRTNVRSFGVSLGTHARLIEVR
jgi:hypothetical protein